MKSTVHSQTSNQQYHTCASPSTHSLLAVSSFATCRVPICLRFIRAAPCSPISLWIKQWHSESAAMKVKRIPGWLNSCANSTACVHSPTSQLMLTCWYPSLRERLLQLFAPARPTNASQLRIRVWLITTDLTSGLWRLWLGVLGKEFEHCLEKLNTRITFESTIEFDLSWPRANYQGKHRNWFEFNSLRAPK